MSRATAPPRDLIRPCQRLLTPFSALHPRVGAYRPPRCSRPWRSPERSGFACAVKQNTSSHTNFTFVFSCIRTNPSAFDSPFNAAYLSRILCSLTRAHPQECTLTRTFTFYPPRSHNSTRTPLSPPSEQGGRRRTTQRPVAQHFKFSSSSHFMSCPLRNRWSKRSALTIDCFCVTAAD